MLKSLNVVLSLYELKLRSSYVEFYEEKVVFLLADFECLFSRRNFIRRFEGFRGCLVTIPKEP